MEAIIQKKLLFEPWGLGDAVIAASILREAPEKFCLVCNEKWLEIISRAANLSGDKSIIPVSLNYATRNRKSVFDRNDAGAINQTENFSEILSIRGDIRDWLSARKAFPGVPIRMSGWLPFMIRRSRLLDLPFSIGLITIRNRYEAWAELAGIPFENLKKTYRESMHRQAGGEGDVVVHIGAQWQSRQYPYTNQLVANLKKNHKVKLVAGPKDRLPAGISENNVVRPDVVTLLDTLKSASRVITNDSGPMHLSAFLGCRTTVVSRVSNIREWLPPYVSVAANIQPKGYRPAPKYCSDEVIDGWPSVEQVVKIFEAHSE